MKSAAAKTCSGSTILFRHDSSNCSRCFQIKLYYNEFQPALQKLRRAKNNVNVIGIIKFLEACFLYESNGKKIDHLQGQLSNRDSFAKKSAYYSKLLNNILFGQKNSNNVESSLCYFYKNEKCRSNGAAKGKKMELKNVKKTSSIEKKRQISKIQHKKAVSAKPPRTGTLKRQRWVSNTLSKKNEGYEDDVFEEIPFYRFTDEISSSSSDYPNISTPKWNFSLSPKGDSPIPEYKGDCYNIEELLVTRKNAEEFIDRRKKRKLQHSKKK